MLTPKIPEGIGATVRAVRRMYSWIPTAAASVFGVRERLWRTNLPEELEFWDNWLAHEGAQYVRDYRRRIDPNSEFDPDLGRLIHDANATVLDVGAGPITILGYVWNGQRVRITAVDPLAAEYAALLSKYSISPPVQTLTGRGEELAAIFPANCFDITHARNCLDHSIDAPLSIEQMYAVTKPGGIIYLRHHEAEARSGGYQGLHRWNFELINEEMTVSSPGRAAVNLNRRFAHMETRRTGDLIEAIIRKPS